MSLTNAAQALPSRPLRVLLVDDTAEGRFLTQEAFVEHAGRAVVDTCESGAQALAHLRCPEMALPDVLLLDLHMPGLTGFDVLAQMKDDSRLSVIPVVVISGSSYSQDTTRADTMHASAYMLKSHDFHIFVRQINAFVQFWRQARTIRWPDGVQGL